MIEQLHATRLRLAVETAVGSGVASGGYVVPPTVAAAASRRMKTSSQRQDVFRQPAGRQVVAESWDIRSSHEVGLPFMRWLLHAHGIDRGSQQFTFDPEAVGPTYVLETETQLGQRAQFSGMRLAEVQLVFEESKIVTMECQWVALRRTTPAAALPAGTEYTGGVIATQKGQAAATTGNWGPNPRTDDAVNVFGAQLFFQRDIEASDFGPDGVAGGHTRRPWRLLGEIYMPETAGITDTAFSDEWQGKLALWVGAGTDQVRIDNAQGMIRDDDLKGYDFRVRRLVFEAFTDTRRAVCEIRG